MRLAFLLLLTGDPGGAFHRALATFPNQDMVQRVLAKYYVQGGKPALEPYKTLPLWTVEPPQALLEACVLANYAEVWLAKHHDDGSPVPEALVGTNRLTKASAPNKAKEKSL